MLPVTAIIGLGYRGLPLVNEDGIKLTPFDELPQADAIVAAVSHRECRAMPTAAISRKLVDGDAFKDVTAAFDAKPLSQLGYRAWRL